MFFECIPRRVGLVGDCLAMFKCGFTNDVVSLDDETHSRTVSVKESLDLDAFADWSDTRLTMGTKTAADPSYMGKTSSTQSLVQAGSKAYDPRPVLIPGSIALRARCCMVAFSQWGAQKRTCGCCSSHGRTC